MRRWDAQHPALWPGESQRMLLRALLRRGDDAKEAWASWSAEHDLRNVEVEDSALLPPLYLAADRLGIVGADRSVLSEAYRGVWLKNEFAIAHLRHLLKAFAKERIPAIALKGVPLLLFYYGDVGARRMADVDLLVREADLPAVACVLDTFRWGSATGMPSRQILPYHHAMHWHHADGFHLDLHWRALTPDAAPNAEEELWRRSEMRQHGGIEWRLPCPADLLILMCYHGRKRDRLARGRWVLDVAQILQSCGDEIDTDDFRRRVAQCGLTAPVSDALDYVGREFGIDLHGLAMKSEGSGDPDAAMRYRELARHALENRGLAETLKSAWWRWAAVQRARGEKARWTSFLDFYLEDRRWAWGLDRRSQVARHALRKALSRLRHQGF